MTNPIEEFEKAKEANIAALGEDAALKKIALDFMIKSGTNKYTYNFTWMGIPVIQFPQDMVAMQELIWEVKPDLIIETGIAHGGSILFYASILELVGSGSVLGVDVDIRAHNRQRIEAHPMAHRVQMIQGSSIAPETVKAVHEAAKGKKKVMVLLDSNHTHQHVKAELDAYASLVTKDSYLVVFDTAINDVPDELFKDRPWNSTNNPKTAVWEFLKTNDRFVIDKSVENKLLITVAPDGYLKCTKD